MRQMDHKNRRKWMEPEKVEVLMKQGALMELGTWLQMSKCNLTQSAYATETVEMGGRDRP